ncbi:TVP38/TMEM64 family protein [Streptomyces sp. RKND-216]|uniref:TVP38/TMEM64 family protein n=1 Tax=Streptomyces sp. RKND-216 TaxID=2562581 RepID=UPI00109E20D8|nr:VTT domain-containing protein [Streptomyces sp. RKND-216]THA24710.1 TVP38/TMEM64 family protein [Streptomyces sp. RKND-216]
MTSSVAKSASPLIRLVHKSLAPRPRLAMLPVVLGAAAVVVIFAEPQRLITEDGMNELSAALAVPLFVVAFAACTVAFVPRPFLNLAAGAFFGAYLGVAAGLAGTLLGAGVSFGLGRLLGQDALRPLLKAKLLTAADRQMSGHGFRSMLVVRLLPGIPFAGSNLAAAVSRMRWPAFLTGTGLGAVPSTAAYVVAGSQASTPTSPAFLAAFSFLALTAAGGSLLAWRKHVPFRASPALPAPASIRPTLPLPAGVLTAVQRTR